MRYYANNSATNVDALRSFGSDAVERIIARQGVKAVRLIEGPDSIGCYLATLDNGDAIDVSATECTPHMFLNSRIAIKMWLNAAIANGHKIARDSATIRDENADLVALAIAGMVRESAAA